MIAAYTFSADGDLLFLLDFGGYWQASQSPHAAYAQFNTDGTYTECLAWLQTEGLSAQPEWKPLAWENTWDSYPGMLFELVSDEDYQRFAEKIPH